MDPITQYLDEIAYTNLDYKVSQHPDPSVGKALKIQQMGVQYLLFMQELAKKRAELYLREAERERASIEQMRELKRKQELKIRELETRNRNSEYLEQLHEDKLRKVRTAKKMVSTLTGIQ